jgi:hypothetical protein
MSDKPKNRDQFLQLSTRLFDDFKAWLLEARDHDELTAEQLATLNDAAAIINLASIRVARAIPK